MFGIKTMLRWYYFDRICLFLNKRRIGRKQQIRVLFILTDLSLWKTELLYLKMVSHPRFVPLLGITPTFVDKENARQRLRDYCTDKKYPFMDISVDRTLIQQTKADIILYSEPYQSNYWHKHRFLSNKKALFVYVPYGMHFILEDWNINELLYLHAWQYYFENELTAKEFAGKMKNQGVNLVVTGLPFQDQLMNMRNERVDPWKSQRPKKRIIYAPHHTIGSKKNPDMKGINYSTFLDYADFMLEMAVKYKELIQIAFKPHPYLKMKLFSEWGEEKTEAYYKKWEEMENTQLESGNYMSLFYYSDAMIHDCCAFTVEYLYTKNPVMYLVKDSHHADNLSQFATDAFNLHYHGHNKEQIEQFIVDVINGVDERKVERETYYRENLTPTGNKTACDNIIEAILKGLR